MNDVNPIEARRADDAQRILNQLSLGDATARQVAKELALSLGVVEDLLDLLSRGTIAGNGSAKVHKVGRHWRLQL